MSAFLGKGVMGGEDHSPALLPLSSRDGSILFGMDGDPDQIGRLLEEFRPYLLAIANAEFPQFLAGELAPSDVVQQTIAKGFDQYRQFRGQTLGEFGAWLRKILLNRLRTETRSLTSEKRSHVRAQLVDSNLVARQLSPSGVAVGAEERQRLNSALARLPEIYQQAISLRYSENLTFGQIGVRLNRSEEAARKLWARAIKQLQEQLGIDDSRQLSVPRGRV